MEQTFAVQDKETRRQIRKTIYDAVCDNALATKETVLMTYQGFQIVLPTNMRKEKPYVWLQREGRYYVELGDSEVGSLIRLDNAIEGLPAHLEKLEKNKSFLTFCGSRFGKEPLGDLYDTYLEVVGEAGRAAVAKQAGRNDRSTGGGSTGGVTMTASQQRSLDAWNAANPDMAMTAKEFLKRSGK